MRRVGKNPWFITAIILLISVGLMAYYDSVSRTTIKVTSNTNWHIKIRMYDTFFNRSKSISDVRNGNYTYMIHTELIYISLRRQGWMALPPVSDDYIGLEIVKRGKTIFSEQSPYGYINWRHDDWPYAARARPFYSVGVVGCAQVLSGDAPQSMVLRP